MRIKAWFARGPLFAIDVWMSVPDGGTGESPRSTRERSWARSRTSRVRCFPAPRSRSPTKVRASRSPRSRRADGTFIFTPIRTGAYTVEVEFPGFKKGGGGAASPSAIQDTAVVDFSLQPGGVAEEVVVTGESRRCSRLATARSARR